MPSPSDPLEQAGGAPAPPTATAIEGPSPDALLPAAMARKAEEVGVAKVGLPLMKMFVLAVLAGVFISFGAVLATVATASSGTPGAPGAAPALPFGVSRLLAGLVFSLGLVLVVVAGAELFTGNTLIVMAWASRRVTTARVLRSWAVVYAGNLVGAVATAAFVYWSGQPLRDGGAVGRRALEIARAKTSLPVRDAVILGILANVLVCLAIWLTLSARTVIDKVAAIVFPITAFVAAGFEHSIANMYFIPAGLLVKSQAPGSFWSRTGLAKGTFAHLNLQSFVIGNLLPVTAGNIIGGALLVGLVYWFVYLRDLGSGSGQAPRNVVGAAR